MSMTPSSLPPGAFSGNVLFYSKPEPLSRETHGHIGLRRMDKPFGFVRKANVVPLTVSEFAMAGLTYPIIFAGERRQPLAVMGVGQGQNLFVSDDGAFELGVYIPAYVRRYPFVLAQDSARSQMVVCIDRAAPMLGEDYDLPFFDEKGEPSEYMQNCLKFCNDFETEVRRTESFVNLLTELDLFEVKRATYNPLNADGTPGELQSVAEFFGVSDEKLRALAPEKVSELFVNGALQQIQAHLMSLLGWERLITRMLAAQPAQVPANLN